MNLLDYTRSVLARMDRYFLPLFGVGLVLLAVSWWTAGGRDDKVSERMTEDRPVEEPARPAPQSGEVAVGRAFPSLDALRAAQQKAGFVSVGRFGNRWPATVTEVLAGRDGISFVRGDGTRHEYTGFEGYRMQVVRLAAADRSEVMVVFRAESKD